MIESVWNWINGTNIEILNSFPCTGQWSDSGDVYATIFIYSGIYNNENDSNRICGPKSSKYIF
jgi:hypothetical protein